MIRPRLAATFAFVQKVLGTRFEISLSEGVENEGAIIEISRTERGISDRGAFAVAYDPQAAAEHTDEELIGDVLHEWLHAMLYDAWENGQAGRRNKAAQAYRDAHESGVHALERSLLPLLLQRRKRCRKPRPVRSSPKPEAPTSSGG